MEWLILKVGWEASFKIIVLHVAYDQEKYQKWIETFSHETDAALR